MFSFLSDLVLDLLRCPRTMPDPPAGSHDSVVMFRAAPSYLTYRLLGMWLSLAGVVLLEIIAVVMLVATGSTWELFLAALLLTLAFGKSVFFYVITRLDYEMRYYIITDRSLRIREGVLHMREITLTFENVQNMKIVQGPVQRLFDIHNLVVETAGGGSAVDAQDPSKPGMMHQAIFRGIGRPTELRDLILGYLRQVRTAGLGDHEGPGAPANTAIGLGPEELYFLRAIRAETGALRATLAPSSA